MKPGFPTLKRMKASARTLKRKGGGMLVEARGEASLWAQRKNGRRGEGGWEKREERPFSSGFRMLCNTPWFCHGGNLNVLSRHPSPIMIVVTEGLWSLHPAQWRRKKHRMEAGQISKGPNPKLGCRACRPAGARNERGFPRRKDCHGLSVSQGILPSRHFFMTSGERFRGQTASILVKDGADMVSGRKQKG